MAYIKGVQYLLSDSPDAAIDQLTRAVQINPSQVSIETYFALGKLFRRKGNLTRAIRLHQNILLSPGLAPESKREAQLQLAIDLQGSGMHSRATEAFEKFLAESGPQPEALRRLREVREDAEDFEGAAEVQLRGVRAGFGGHGILAHLLAEAARRALARGSTDDARRLAEAAASALPDSVDAKLALAEVHLAAGRSLEARGLLEEGLHTAPECALALEPALRRSIPDPSELERVLRSALESAPSESALRVAHARALSLPGQSEQGAAELGAVLAADPGFAPARQELGNLLLSEPIQGEARRAFEELLRAVARPESGYSCLQCHHRFSEVSWRCPRCRSWDTLKRDPAPSTARRPLAEAGRESRN